MQLCSPANIEDPVQYDMLLKVKIFMFIKLHYSCKDIHEFKQQPKVYDKLRNDYDSVNPPKSEVETKSKIKPA